MIDFYDNNWFLFGYFLALYFNFKNCHQEFIIFLLTKQLSTKILSWKILQILLTIELVYKMSDLILYLITDMVASFQNLLMLNEKIYNMHKITHQRESHLIIIWIWRLLDNHHIETSSS